MKITNISNHEFRKIKQYIPDNGIGNMECTLYILKSKNRWNKDYKLFKKFNNINGEYFSNKLYIINSYSSVSKYLTFNSNLYDYHKYPLDEDDIHIPNKNTIYLSYIYMILNYVSGVNYIQDISLPDYYRYMQRLRDLGLSQELVDIFSNIYSECDNTNPVQLIESIPDNIKIFNYKGITK